jgi:hypothetical protein
VQIPKESHRIFTNKVLDSLEKDKLVVLFSQDFTFIDDYLNSIKKQVALSFQNDVHSISVPSFIDDEGRYFDSIAKDCRLDCEVKTLQDWKEAMRKQLIQSKKPLLLFINDIENGNEALDRKFSTLLRNFKTEFPHFHALLVGRKALAKLVYDQGHLSPLNTATELFFPENNQKLSEDRIVQQFSTFGKEREKLCQLLNKEKPIRFVVWSYNNLVNQLFWKNLLVKKGRYFAWRGELTKELGVEVLGCDEVVI